MSILRAIGRTCSQCSIRVLLFCTNIMLVSSFGLVAPTSVASICEPGVRSCANSCCKNAFLCSVSRCGWPSRGRQKIGWRQGFKRLLALCHPGRHNRVKCNVIFEIQQIGYSRSWLASRHHLGLLCNICLLSLLMKNGLNTRSRKKNMEFCIVFYLCGSTCYCLILICDFAMEFSNRMVALSSPFVQDGPLFHLLPKVIFFCAARVIHCHYLEKSVALYISHSWDQLNLRGLLYIFRHCYLNFISVNFVKHCIFHTVRRLRFRLLKLVIGTWKELLMFSTANHKLLLLILDIWKRSTTDIKVKYFTLCCSYHLFCAFSLIFFTCTIILCHDCSEPDADMIMVEGISQLCNDLQVMFLDFFFFLL